MKSIVLGEILIAGLASLLISIFLGPKYIQFLRQREFGQHIREEGPEAHRLTKAGTPTMGGLVILTAIAIPYLILSERDAASLTVFGVAFGCAAIGFADDWLKIVKARSLGLSARTKLCFQLVIAVALWYLATHTIGLADTLNLRISDIKIDIGVFYVVFVFLVLAGATNGVNLTDGLDGLAAGCCAVVLLTYTAMAFITGSGEGLSGSEREGLALLGACLVGASRRISLVQLLPRRHLHGRYGLARPRRRDRRHGGDDEVGGAADRDRRHLRDRGAVGGDAGVQLPHFPPPHAPDGAAASPLRAARLVGEQDHRALLDHDRDLLRDRLHALSAERRSLSHSPVAAKPRPALPPSPYLVVGLARSGVAAALALRAADGEAGVVACDSGQTAGGARSRAAGLRAAGVEVHLDTDGTELLVADPPPRTRRQEPRCARRRPPWSRGRASSGWRSSASSRSAGACVPNEFWP